MRARDLMNSGNPRTWAEEFVRVNADKVIAHRSAVEDEEVDVEDESNYVTEDELEMWFELALQAGVHRGRELERAARRTAKADRFAEIYGAGATIGEQLRRLGTVNHPGPGIRHVGSIQDSEVYEVSPDRGTMKDAADAITRAMKVEAQSIFRIPCEVCGTPALVGTDRCPRHQKPPPGPTEVRFHLRNHPGDVRRQPLPPGEYDLMITDVIMENHPIDTGFGPFESAVPGTTSIRIEADVTPRRVRGNHQL